MWRRRIERYLGLGVCAFALAGCGDGVIGSGGGSGGGGSSTSIAVGNNFFNPSSSTVANGATVTWTWAAGSAGHNVTFTGGPASPTQSSGTYTRTFTATGTYGYICTIHGSGMSGTIVVQ